MCKHYGLLFYTLNEWFYGKIKSDRLKMGNAKGVIVIHIQCDWKVPLSVKKCDEAGILD